MYLQPVRQPCMHPILPGQPSTVLRTWIVAQGRTGAKKRGRCCGQPKSRSVTTIGPGGLLEPILGYFLVFWGGPQNPQSGLGPDSSTFVDSNPGSHIYIYILNIYIWIFGCFCFDIGNGPSRWNISPLCLVSPAIAALP